MFERLRQDLQHSRGNPKSIIIASLFRLAYWAHSLRTRSKLAWVLFVPYLVFYRVFVEWILGVEIPHKTQIDGGLRVEHGMGIVIHDHTIIGQNLMIRQGVTIGVRHIEGRPPRLGNNVTIGANAIILGDISIGDDVVIGAGAVVLQDVPDNCVVVGNPGRIVKRGPA